MRESDSGEMNPHRARPPLASLSDEDLAALVREGRPHAFDVIVHRYSRELLGYCRRLGLADSRAEDALQGALMRAWVALERGTEVRAVRPWLYRIVHNGAVNMMRSAPTGSVPLSDQDDPGALASSYGDVEHLLSVRAVLAEVAALPPMQRDAIVMSAIDGRSHEEVASALGVSDGAVRGLLYRARAALRAAAAALIPQPLVNLASEQMNRFGSGAEAIAQPSAPGGLLGGVLTRGLAVAATALAIGGGAAEFALHSTRAGTRALTSRAATATAVVRTPSVRPVATNRAGAASTGDGARAPVARSGLALTIETPRSASTAPATAPEPTRGTTPVAVSPPSSAAPPQEPSAPVSHSAGVAPVGESGRPSAPAGTGAQGTEASGGSTGTTNAGNTGEANGQEPGDGNPSEGGAEEHDQEGTDDAGEPQEDREGAAREGEEQRHDEEGHEDKADAAGEEGERKHEPAQERDPGGHAGGS